jgi:hypothetical protein
LEEIGREEADQIGLVVPAFVVQGKKPRLVVDYTTQNHNHQDTPFRMEGLLDLAPQLRPNDILFMFDTSDAYYHLKLRLCDRDKLLFRVGDHFFRPLCLNCGLKVAHSFFTSLMRSVLAELRRLGHRIIGFLDDTCGAQASASPTVAASPADSARSQSELLELYSRLGLTVHPNKVDFSSSSRLDMLAVPVDSAAGFFSPSLAKLANVRSSCANLLSYARHNQRLARLRHLPAVLGLLSSLYRSVGQCRLRLRPLHDAVPLALQSPSRSAWLSHQVVRDLRWWASLTDRPLDQQRPLWPSPSPDVVLNKDACGAGWGGHVEAQATSGLLLPEELPFSINVKEVLAALLSVEAFVECLRHRNVLLRSDNSVAVFALRNWTSKSSVIMVLLRRLRSLVETFGIMLYTEHIPGVLNLWADKLSRHRDAEDWFLSPSAFAQSEAVPVTDSASRLPPGYRRLAGFSLAATRPSLPCRR